MQHDLKEWIGRGFALAIGGYTAIHFAELFYDSALLTNILSLLGALAIIFGLLYLWISKKSPMIPLCLLAISVVINIISGQNVLSVMTDGLLKMRSLIGFLFVIPMIGWILEDAPYIESIMYVARHLFKTSRRFYFGMMLMTQLISYFLLFGSLPVSYQFEDFFLKERKGLDWEYFKGTGILRAFALSTLWVVSIPSFIYAVSSMNGSLGLSILQGFVISMLAMLLAVAMMSAREKRRQVDFTAGLQQGIINIAAQSDGQGKEWRYVWQFIFLFVSLFGLIFVIHGFWDVDLLFVIPLIIVAWTVLYYAIKRYLRRLSRRVTYYSVKGVRSKALQFSLMLSAGLMIASLQSSGWAAVIVQTIIHIGDMIPFINVLWLLPFILILLGFTGLGPLTVMVLVGSVLQGSQLPYPPELIILSLTSGSVISLLLSPIVMPVIVLSDVNGLSAYKNGIGFNVLFAAAFYLLVQLYLQCMVWLM